MSAAVMVLVEYLWPVTSQTGMLVNPIGWILGIALVEETLFVLYYGILKNKIGKEHAHLLILYRATILVIESGLQQWLQQITLKVTIFYFVVRFLFQMFPAVAGIILLNKKLSEDPLLKYLDFIILWPVAFMIHATYNALVIYFAQPHEIFVSIIFAGVLALASVASLIWFGLKKKPHLETEST